MANVMAYSVSAQSLTLVSASTGEAGRAPELTYFGRASVKIVSSAGNVVYIDPYAPGDYSLPADIILVTHGHGDHNNVKLVARKASTVLAAPAGAVAGRGASVVSELSRLEVAGGAIQILALPAANKNHAREECVGYLVSFDGIAVYHAGDTSYLPEMDGYSRYAIAYALLPCDGFYNMGPEEAARCAVAMKAKRVLPIHSDKSELFGEKNARELARKAPGIETIVLKPGDRISLRL